MKAAKRPTAGLLKTLGFEQYKNFRILLRNISSLLLLVLGPLALILLVGFAYSGDSLHDINIGVISSDYTMLQPAFQNFSTYANIVKYDNVDDCVEDLRLENMHACLEFSDDFGKESTDDNGLVSGKISFYYDNSRKPISTKVVEAVSAFFGVQAEKVSIESATTILTEIQDFVTYVESKNKDIVVLLNESENIKLSLIDRHEKLVKLRDEFVPVYTEIKFVQGQLDNVSKKLDESYSQYNDSRSGLDAELRVLKLRLKELGDIVPPADFYLYNSLGGMELTDNLSMLASSNLTYYNLSDYNYDLDLEGLLLNVSGVGNYTNLEINLSNTDEYMKIKLATLSGTHAVDRFEKELDNFTGTTEEYYSYLSYQKTQFDAAVSLIDDVNDMLDADIKATEEYITKIDAAVVRVKATQSELNSSISVFSGLEPGMAEKLIKPFLQEYEPIIPGVSNIQQAYPGMIAIIVIFISILFANIVTLGELNSKAFFRNLLAPVNKLVFIAGLLISVITIVLFQVAVLLLVGQFSFGIDVFSAIGNVVLVVALLALLFIAIGMIIAILIRSEQSSVLTTTFVALAFFLFSNAVTPIEIMPKLAGFFASQNPYVIATTAFRKILIFHMSTPLLAPEIVRLVIYLAVALAVLVIVSARKLKA
jgi:ABC-type multidrug transport system permease subunit